MLPDFAFTVVHCIDQRLRSAYNGRMTWRSGGQRHYSFLACLASLTLLGLFAVVSSAIADARRLNQLGGSPKASFLNDIEPILTHAGCNSGSCHGSQFGKGGFKLSLAAYDPELDYRAVTAHAGGRRLNRMEPALSLLLKKPALQSAHVGG